MGRNFITSSFLGSLLFNIFLCDLFFIMVDSDFASYEDDGTPYTIVKDMRMLFSNFKIRQKYLVNCLCITK